MASIVILSLAPAIAMMAYIYLRDVYEPEPRTLVVRFFLIGALLVAPAALVEAYLGAVLPNDVVIQSFVVIGLTEELTKFLACMLLAYRNSHFDEEMDGVVYCSAVSLGFASSENLLYISSNGLATGFLRALLPVPGHALFAIVMGHYMGKAKFSQGDARTRNLVKALFAPAAIHGAFNFLLMSDPAVSALVIPLMVYLWISGIGRMRQAQAVSPYKRGREASSTM